MAIMSATEPASVVMVVIHVCNKSLAVLPLVVSVMVNLPLSFQLWKRALSLVK